MKVDTTNFVYNPVKFWHWPRPNLPSLGFLDKTPPWRDISTGHFGRGTMGEKSIEIEEIEEIELDWLKKWAQFHPEKTALIDGDSGRRLSYGEFYHQSCAGAYFLKQKFGVGRGDRVAMLAQNSLDLFVLFFACQRLGAILVPMNFRLTQRELDHILSDSEPKVFVGQEIYHSVWRESAEPRTSAWCSLEGSGSFSESLKTTKFQDTAEVWPTKNRDAVMILYTSGTTGFPKGAVLSHQMLFWNSINTALRLSLSSVDSAVIFLPLFHTGGWNVLSTPLLHHGATVILTKKFDPAQVLSLSTEHQTTLIFGVPTTMQLMSRENLFADADLKSVRYAIVGGEPMPVESIKTWQAKGVPIRQGYGLTEFGPNVFSLSERDSQRKMGSIGFANFYTQVKVVDDENHELGADTIGELCLKGPMCMTEYWRNPKATAETIRDGWLHTGDLVRFDSEGYFYVVGRKKDMFISGGENVYPTEVEAVLRAIPGILEVAVIGIPDDKWGEVGQAFLVLDPKSKATPPTQTDLLRHCQQNLAKFKIPKHFVTVPTLPKGDSGKILKRELQREWQAGEISLSPLV